MEQYKCFESENKMVQKKKYEILFVNVCFFMAFYFGVTFFSHYGLDDYIAMHQINEFHYNALSNGRYALLLINDFFIKINFNPVIGQKIMAIILVFAFAIGSTSIAQYIIELLKITEKKSRFLIVIGSMLFFANVFITEWFSFVLTYAQWILAVIGSVYGAIFVSKTGVKNKTIGFIFVLLMVNSYQAMIPDYAIMVMAFLYIKYINKNIKFGKLVLQLIEAGILVIVATISNIILTKILILNSIVDPNSRYSAISFSFENIKNLFQMQKSIWIDGKGLMTHGILIIFMICLCAAMVMSVIRNKIQIKDALLGIGLAVVGLLACFALQMLFVVSTPRSLVPIFGIYSFLVYLIVIWSIKDNLAVKLTIVSVLAFLCCNFYNVWNVSIGMFQLNALEKEYARQIEYQIHKYEQETGNNVRYICFYKDMNPQYKYDLSVKPESELLNKSYMASWGDIYMLYYYTNLEVEKIDPKEEWSEYFAIKDWHVFDPDEQMKFEDDTLNLCFY